MGSSAKKKAEKKKDFQVCLEDDGRDKDVARMSSSGYINLLCD